MAVENQSKKKIKLVKGKAAINNVVSLADNFINVLLRPVGYQNLAQDALFPFQASEIIQLTR